MVCHPPSGDNVSDFSQGSSFSPTYIRANDDSDEARLEIRLQREFDRLKWKD